jgi:hypothetical protein
MIKIKSFGKKRKKVGEKDVEEFQLLCLLDEWDVEASGAINEQHILWKKKISMYKNTPSHTGR